MIDENNKKNNYTVFVINEFRQFITLNFKYLNIGFGFYVERVIDDIVCLFMLMGNEVLPNLPFLSYNEGGLDCILYIYKRVLPFLEGYLTDNGELDASKLSVLFKDLGFAEEIMLKNVFRY
jgi:5'-3' exoribonuclease 2